MLTKRDLFRSAAAIAAGAAIARPSRLMAQSYPGIIEAKDIAEEGFIYGLPLVMNYAVMHEFAVDPKSSQFKAPFNKIDNLNHVATYEDTAVVTPNSDTPYSILWLDLRAEPMVISVSAVEKERYYSVQLIDGNTYNFGYIGSRATETFRVPIWLSDPTGKARNRPASAKSFPRPPRSCSPIFGLSLSTSKICRTWKRYRPATRRSRFPLS